jgi:hypothetical protein
MTMRENFEKHFYENWQKLFERTRDGQYEFERDSRWIEWQAACASRDAEIKALEASVESLVTELARRIAESNQYILKDICVARAAAEAYK